MKFTIFILILFILIIYKLYIWIIQDEVIGYMYNKINSNSSVFDYETYQLLKKSNIPEIIIKNINGPDDINQILKYISTSDQSNHEHINKIKITKKAVILISGENGSGKTNLVFQLNNYFIDYHHCILATIDNYKQNYQEFLNYAHNNKANIFYPVEENMSLKKITEMYLKDFLLTQYSLLIIDTSGRSINNIKLQNEITSVIQFTNTFCQENNIMNIMIYNISGLRRPLLPDNINEFDFLTISQINYRILPFNTIDELTRKHKILFFSTSNNFSDIHVYNNILLANMISKKISYLINKKNDHSNPK